MIKEWAPDKTTTVWMNVVGLGTTIAGLVGFATLYAAVNSGTVAFAISARELVLILAIVVHELLHGFALRTLGAKPKYGATMVGGAMPAFYCTSPGVLLSKKAFTYVALLPGIVLAVMPALWIIFHGPFAGWLVVPAAMLLGGTVGDWFMTVVALRAPRGALIEDNKEGLRIHLPAE
ncbi:DUF3267 domain-containing protein [Corynebacterium sp. H128]|uniref:DUF3267 domain-containing protein n=1 Tax=Corynebacterium sp. H128 TaxID=3133427 RepID=UPI0030AE03E5